MFKVDSGRSPGTTPSHLGGVLMSSSKSVAHSKRYVNGFLNEKSKANASRLTTVTKSIIKQLNNELNIKLDKRKTPVGKSKLMKKFSTVSEDKNTVMHIQERE